jgi:hypothetical protein
VNTRRAKIVAVAMTLTFVIIRSMMQLSPNADFNVAGYNIHHLFTGLLLIVVGGIPLALFPGRSRGLDLAALTFGIGLSLALDEWVYLIVTDGTNASYLLPVSFHGGIIAVGLAVAYVAILYMLSRDKQPPSNS